MTPLYWLFAASAVWFFLCILAALWFYYCGKGAR